MTEFTTEFVSGKIYWAKVFKPVDNYERTGKEWTFDFVPDEKGIEVLKKHRLLDRLKEPRDPIPGDYIRLRKPELDKDGNRNDPIRVLDEDNEDWENGNIGNGSSADLRLTIADFGKGKKKAIWTSAIRVTDHVPHEGGTQSDDPFGGYSSSSASPKKTTKKAPKGKTVVEELDELDDDIPF